MTAPSHTEQFRKGMADAIRQVNERVASQNERKIKTAIEGNMKSGIGITTRFIAMGLGVPIGDVHAMLLRSAALGLVERFEINGEFYWRRPDSEASKSPSRPRPAPCKSEPPDPAPQPAHRKKGSPARQVLGG